MKSRAGLTWVTLTMLLAPSAVRGQDLPGLSDLEVTANVGWLSEYFYRGILQKASSASAGIDLALSGLYVGTWAADVGDGAEVDLFGGYGVGLGPVSLSVGGTGYFYTGEFDDTYLEGNVEVGVGPVAVQYAIGSYETKPVAQDYSFVALVGEYRGAYGIVGSFGGDFSGSYGEVGYGFEASGLDVTVSWVWNDADLSGLDRADHTVVLGVGRTFSLR